jgi:uncharacterized membrane protein YdjX (TVP38/TMEM64 family)
MKDVEGNSKSRQNRILPGKTDSNLSSITGDDIGKESENNFEHLLEAPDESSAKSIRKDFVFVLILVVLLVVAYFSPLRGYLEKAPELCSKINRAGFMAPLIFTIAVCVLVSIGVPRLLLCPIGGMAFGFLPGLTYCIVGTLIAYYIIFLFVRWGGKDFILRHYPRFNRFAKVLERGGIPGVILARQMPVHGMVVNLVLGLSPVGHFDFLAGTLIGLIPEAVPCTLVGTGAMKGSLGKTSIYLIIAIVLLASLWLGLKIHSRKKHVA